MPIKYKLLERGEPGVVGGGTKKWYAQIAYGDEMDIDDLVSEIEKFSALSEADIKGVIVALENVIQKALADSRIVRLEKLGSLYPALSSEGVVHKEEFVAKTHIKKMRVNYRAGKRIVDSMNTATLKRES